MKNEIMEIAMRIRDLREISGMTVEETAKQFNLSAGVYKSYEGGNEDIPMGFLIDFANFFKVELTDLLTGRTPKLHTYCFVKKDRGVDVERRSCYKYQNLAYNFANKKAEPFLVTVDKNNAEVNLNSHEGHEFNYCVEGRLLITINDQEIIMEPGDSLYFDSMAPHGMRALDGKPAKFLAIILK
jgi:quercetin dioxygenase-like cupin family protein